MPRTKQSKLMEESQEVVPIAPSEVVFDGGEWFGLTDRQRLFIEQYFTLGLNGTEAALAVYNCSTRESAAVQASVLLRNPNVRAHINDRLDQFHLSANEVLARIAFHARGSMEEFIDPDSGTIDLKKAKQAKQLGLIKRYKTKFTTFTTKDGDESETVETEIELYDAQAALRDLGKHHKLFGSDIEVNILAGRRMEDLTVEELQALANNKPLPPKAGGAG